MMIESVSMGEFPQHPSREHKYCVGSQAQDTTKVFSGVEPPPPHNKNSFEFAPLQKYIINEQLFWKQKVKNTGILFLEFKASNDYSVSISDILLRVIHNLDAVFSFFV